MIDAINATVAKVLAFAVVVLLLISITLGITVRIQKAELAAATAKNATKAAQLKTLGDQVAGQNAAVDQLLANAAIAAEQYHRSIVAAAHVQVTTRERIQYVQQAAIPTTCPEAITWGTVHAVKIGKRWEAAQ